MGTAGAYVRDARRAYGLSAVRVPHFLRANKGCELPHVAIFTDTETDQRKLRPKVVAHVLRFGMAAYQRTTPRGDWTEPEWARFTSPRAFWDWVEARARARTRVFIFAHNWGFDAPVLHTFDELPRRGWTLTRAIIECPPVILSWRRDTATILMLDTLNWWREPLSVLGDSVGIPKLRMPSKRASRAVWDRYCRRDVEVIRQSLHHWWRFLSDHDLGGFASTLAAQAFRTYRHRFMDSEILIDDDGDALTLARAAYHGGRCEAFRIGRVKGPVHVLDITSMYPYVMQEHLFPAKLHSVCEDVTLRELRHMLKHFCVVAHVDLETEEPAYAHKVDGRLCFPVGRFSECLCTPELQYAVERRHVKRIHLVAVYSREPLFRSFVTELWGHRLEAMKRGDKVRKELFKKLMNSLYGKFGQRSGKWEMHGKVKDKGVKVWDEVDADTGRVLSMRQFAGIMQQRYADREARESHPAIAAHVTAYGRMLLWSLLSRAGRAECCYVDTDSLWVSGLGLKRLRRLIVADRLGYLKLEGTHRWVKIHGAKDYQTPRDRKIKGVRKTAVWKSGNTVTQEKWSSLKGLCRLGQMNAPLTETITKHLARDYRKGILRGDGRVLPFTLDEW